MQSYWLQTANELSVSRVQVAANYSDSVPDSSNHNRNHGYHPLEELKECEKNKNKNMKLADAEIARTVVEANSKALVIFPGGIHNEPHRHASWAEFHYVIDDYGDIFFELFNDENILQDPNASSPVIVLIGYDSPIYGEKNAIFDTLEMDEEEGIGLPEFKEIDDTEVTDTLISWGMPDTLRYTHPLYFAKCLTKVVQTRAVRFNPYLWPPGQKMTNEIGKALFSKAGELGVPVGFMCMKGLSLHISEIEELCESYSSTVVLLDHMGFCKPPLTDEERYALSSLLKLSRFPQVYVKFSALFRLSRNQYPYEDTRDILSKVISSFGANHVMWGSDFPFVVKECGYREAKEAVSLIANRIPLSSADMEWIMGRTLGQLFHR